MKNDWALHRIAPFVRRVGEIRLPPAYAREWLSIYEQALIYVLDGQAEFRMGGKKLRIVPGDLLLVPAGTPTMLCTGKDAPVWLRFMRFDYDFAGDYDVRPLNSLETEAHGYRCHTPPAPPSLKLPRRMNVRDDPRVALLFDSAICEVEEKAPGYELMVRAYLMQLLTIIHRRSCGRKGRSRAQRWHSEPVRRALAFMEANVARPLTLAEIARAAGLSKPRFSCVFHRATGFSPLRFLMRLRVRLAKSMLWHETATVKEVAISVGFEDPHHFTRVFHRLEGITPTDFREMVINADAAFKKKLVRADTLPVRGPFFTIPPRRRR